MVASPSIPQPPEPETDGRRRRAETSRRRIVEAMLALVSEGQAAPPAEAVAERAGVGLRTVFRLFKDMDGLYREMQATMLRRLEPLFHDPLAGEDWRTRLTSLMERRARVFDELMPMKVAGDAHRARSTFLQDQHRQFVRLQREMLLSVLPGAVSSDPELLDALDVALSFDAWRRLRVDQELDRSAALRVMARSVEALVRGI